jgi:hypothetical protein
MADTNKLVSMIALVLSGLLIAAWGAIYIWLYRKDQGVITDLRNRGSISAQDAARLTNPTWMWVLSIVQIVIGIALVIWGVFQYFMKVDDVVATVKAKTSTPTLRNGLNNGSRRVFSTDFNGNRVD